MVSPDIRGVAGTRAFLSGSFDYTVDLRGKKLEFGKQERTGNRSQFRLQDGRTAIPTNLIDLGAGSVRAAGGAVRRRFEGRGELRDMLTLAGSSQRIA